MSTNQPITGPLLEDRVNGTFYIGPLEPAQALVRDEYGEDLRVTVHASGAVTVGEYRGAAEPNQWGTSAEGDEEEAWRYLLGADFGPLDSEYDEAHLIRLLTRFAERSALEKIHAALEAHSGAVLDFVAGQIAHLGSRSEWSMDDNFNCTEGMARLAEQVGLPPAGDQPDEALLFYAEAAADLGYIDGDFYEEVRVDG